MKQFIIGRKGNQPFPIDPNEFVYVHGEHCRITINNGNNWTIEDLKAPQGNGVYIRDKDGVFRRVTYGQISPNDIIRLGPEHAQSFTFMAHHLITPNDYKYEFGYMSHLDSKLRKEEEAQAASMKKHMLVQIIVPLICALLTFSVRLFRDIDSGILAAIAPVMMVVPAGIIRYFYRNDNDKLKEIKARRPKLVQCPKCWYALSDHDLHQHRCSRCKAM